MFFVRETLLLFLGVFSVYLIYYTSKRICHALINKLIIIPFIPLFDYYVFNIKRDNFILATALIVIYIILIILLAKFLPNYIKERKYLLNHPKYIKIANCFSISEPMENILFFKFKERVNRVEFFITSCFIILSNVFIYTNFYFLATTLRKYNCNGLGLRYYSDINILIQLPYSFLMLYSFFILIYNRLNSIFLHSKYNILFFILLFATNFLSIRFLIREYGIILNILLYYVEVLVFLVVLCIIPSKKVIDNTTTDKQQNTISY